MMAHELHRIGQAGYTMPKPIAGWQVLGTKDSKALAYAADEQLAAFIVRAVDCHEELVKALELIQFGFNHSRCPACAGWNVGPHGETDNAHTADCPVATALAKATG